MAVPAEPVLIWICDLAGRARGTGFLVDDQGTLLTSHEAVDGLGRLVLRTQTGHSELVEAAAVTPLPGCDLALVTSAALAGHAGAGPTGRAAHAAVVVATERPVGTRVLVWAGSWTEATLTDYVEVTYTATDRFHLIEHAVALGLPEPLSASPWPGQPVSGSPVLDATTGAVVAVLGTALYGTHRANGFAVPLRQPLGALEEHEAARLEELIARNNAVVPGRGPDLNLAGALELTSASVAAASAVPAPSRRRPRPEVERAFAAFTRESTVLLALVGEPGTGRSTELAAWAARRVSRAEPEPTIWLRGADLRAGDGGLQDAVGRALAEAGRIAGRLGECPPGTPGSGAEASAHPDVVARLARNARRPLLVLLDGPEEMPPLLAHRLRAWCAGTSSWLQASGARLALACRPEFWEQVGEHFRPDLLYRPPGAPQGALPPHVELPGLPGGHPLTARMLAQLQPVHTPRSTPGRHEVFAAWLALVSLRVATTVGAERHPAVRGPALRRLAASTAGRLHLAARRCLGSGQGGLSQSTFESVFPWHGGWAAAVLSMGVLQPAGDQYRFTDEEFGDWLQGTHLELDVALEALVHSPPVAGAVPVPRHRIGPVVEALLLVAHSGRPAAQEELGNRLRALTEVVHQGGDQGWWAGRLLRQTLTRLPDAQPYLPVLRTLAARLTRGGAHPALDASFFAALPLPTGQLLDLFRQLLPLDGASPVEGQRFLDAAARLLEADPHTVVPLLCRWFSDGRPLRAPGATVARAAGALLYTHRRQATDELADALVTALTTVGGGAARELLGELVQEEPVALSRAVRRWAGDERVDRRAAAARHLPALAANAQADQAELLAAARQLLRHADDSGRLHPAAYVVLLGEFGSRASYLPAACLRFARDPYDPALAEALCEALSTHPREALQAFADRLCGPHHAAPGTATGILTLLARVRTPALARQVAQLVVEYARRHPQLAAEPVAAFVAVRLPAGVRARPALLELVTSLSELPSPGLRAALARTLGAGAAHSTLARELLEPLLAVERDVSVLDAVLAFAQHDEELVRRVGALMYRSPEGAASFDRRMLGPSRHNSVYDRARVGKRHAPDEWAPTSPPSEEPLGGRATPAMDRT